MGEKYLVPSSNANDTNNLQCGREHFMIIVNINDVCHFYNMLAVSCIPEKKTRKFFSSAFVAGEYSNVMSKGSFNSGNHRYLYRICHPELMICTVKYESALVNDFAKLQLQPDLEFLQICKR